MHEHSLGLCSCVAACLVVIGKSCLVHLGFSNSQGTCVLTASISEQSLTSRMILCSVFGDIFDEEHFINSLAQQVRILKELPKEVMSRFENISMIQRVKVKAWSLPRFYLETALPLLKQHGCVTAVALDLLISIFPCTVLKM